MLKENIYNALLEPFPNKCIIINSIIEVCTSMKDLITCFEIIVDCIFSNYSTINNNTNRFFRSNIDLNNNINNTYNNFQRNSNLKNISQFKLKLVTKNSSEYDSVYQFLNTNSLMWSTMFKLEKLWY